MQRSLIPSCRSQQLSILNAFETRERVPLEELETAIRNAADVGVEDSAEYSKALARLRVEKLKSAAIEALVSSLTGSAADDIEDAIRRATAAGVAPGDETIQRAMSTADGLRQQENCRRALRSCMNERALEPLGAALSNASDLHLADVSESDARLVQDALHIVDELRQEDNMRNSLEAAMASRSIDKLETALESIVPESHWIVCNTYLLCGII